MSSCLYTTTDENDRLIVLTMIAYNHYEYRFLYNSNSWKLELHESERVARMAINHALRTPTDDPITHVTVKFRRTDIDSWQSTVLYQKEGSDPFRPRGCQAEAPELLCCAARTLKKIYYG